MRCETVSAIRSAIWFNQTGGLSTEQVRRQRRQMADLVAPLRWIGSCPHHHQHLGYRTDRFKLRHDEDTRALFARIEAISEMTRHRSPVMCDENAVLLVWDLENLRVAQSRHAAVCYLREV